MGIINDKLKKLESEVRRSEKKEELFKYQGDDRVVSAQEKYELLKEQGSTSHIRHSSGVALIDDLFNGGFRIGTVNVVSGPTGEGKTTFLQTLTKNMTEQGTQCMWFPYEGIQLEFFERFGETMPTFYIPREIPESKTTEWMKDRIMEAQVKFDTKAVFIDHLHYFKEMQNLEATDHLSLRIGDIMRQLNELAVELGVVIFLIAHVKTDAGSHSVDRKTHEIKSYYTKDDIRDSSMVKQQADSVILVWRKRKTSYNDAGWEYADVAIVSVDKNRATGKLGITRLFHSHGLFTEQDNF